MNIKNALKPFQRRLTAEALLRSALSAGVIAAGTAVLLGGIHVLLPWLITELWAILIFTGVFAVSFGLLFLIKYRPTKRDLAKRLDQLGLSERVETMLEWEQSDAPGAKLQREDTVNRLQQISKKDLRLRLSKIHAILCGVLLGCAIALLLVPEINLFSRHDIINRLNQLLNDSEVSDDLREDLSDIIDELEDQLNEDSDGSDYAENLQDAQQSIADRIEQEITKDKIGEALMEFEDLRELGEAIQKGDKAAVSEALDNLQEKMEGDSVKQQSVADQLGEALEKSQTPPYDALHQALKNMENGLRDSEQPLETTMDRAETEIHAALDQQQNAAALGQQMQEALNSANPSGGMNGDQPSAPQNGSAGDSSDGANGNSGASGSDGVGGDGAGSGGAGDGSGSTQMGDMISDPSSRFPVAYGDVYAAYVAEFLKQAEAGSLPPEVVAAMNAYLESLKK